MSEIEHLYFLQKYAVDSATRNDVMRPRAQTCLPTRPKSIPLRIVDCHPVAVVPLVVEVTARSGQRRLMGGHAWRLRQVRGSWISKRRLRTTDAEGLLIGRSGRAIAVNAGLLVTHIRHWLRRKLHCDSISAL